MNWFYSCWGLGQWNCAITAWHTVLRNVVKTQQIKEKQRLAFSNLVVSTV